MTIDIRPLAHRDYRRLLVGEAVTVITGQMSVVAVQQQIFSITGSSAWVGASSIVALIPLIAFGLLGGAITDTYDRRTVLLLTSIGIALSLVGLWLNGLLANPSVVVIFAMLALQQGMVAVNVPARMAIIPSLLPLDLVPAANALAMTVFGTLVLIGPLLAGALLPVVGVVGIYLIDALSVLAILYAVYKLPRMPRQGTHAGRAKVLDGLRYLRGRQVLLMTFVVDIIAMVAGMPRALFPEMAQQTFNGPPEGGIQLGLLNVGIALGAAIGGLTSGWLHIVKRQGLVIVISIVIWGFAIAGFGLTSTLWIAVAFLAVGGLADMVSAVFRSTILQVSATDEMRGRMQGVFLVVVAGGPRVADLAHGLLADWTSTRVAVVSGGLTVVVLVVLVAVAFPSLLRYRLGDAL